jgi:hypothetical protein
MRKVCELTLKTIGVILVFCFLAPQAHAYLDPGSGSMMIQLVLAGVAGLGVAIRVYWRRILAFFGFGKKKNHEPGKFPP